MSALAYAPPPAPDPQVTRCPLQVVPPPADPFPPPAPGELWRLLSTVLEIIDGRRPVGQLDDLLPVHRQRALLRELEKRAKKRRKLLSLHASRINRGVLELCASVEQGNRVRALAARLELTRSRWRFASVTLL
jgi:hypothetical protein